eukprot:GCRY01003068.1.p1 GENE.GCRY01003068.1~~GCRY01003068.1.p1  ORF type:complete len:262 (+),score=32.27 GCRY01003068.1:178-963(+)
MIFHQENSSFDTTLFKDSTLLISSVGIGHVAQLVLDLVIFNAPNQPTSRVGVFEAEDVIPIFGENAFGGSSLPSMSLEVYYFENDGERFTLIQQRAPIKDNHCLSFASILAEWVVSQKFSSVFFFSSVDGRKRTTTQMEGPQLFFSSALVNNDSKTGDILKQNEESMIRQLDQNILESEELFSSRGFSRSFLEHLHSNSLNVWVYVRFSFEGLGVYPALESYSQIVRVLPKMAQFAPDSRLKVPPSWNAILAESYNIPFQK